MMRNIPSIAVDANWGFKLGQLHGGLADLRGCGHRSAGENSTTTNLGTERDQLRYRPDRARKNRLVDFAFVCGPNTIEFSIKAARASANPENDMGTFRDRPNRAQLFVDSFTFWIRYDDSMPEIRCDRAFFDRNWRFVGKSTLVDGVKYRIAKGTATCGPSRGGCSNLARPFGRPRRSSRRRSNAVKPSAPTRW